MPHKEKRHRPSRAERPRLFEDRDAFGATTRILSMVGYRRLTLQAVAREVGCSAPALIKRFGSRQALIHAYLEWSSHMIQARYHDYQERYASPLLALRSRFLIPVEERLDEFGVFTDWFEMHKDADLEPTIRAQHIHWEEGATELLQAAQVAGELVACDTERLARTLLSALLGASLTWTPDDGPLLDQYSAIFDVIIDPYRTGTETSSA